jgi:dipeptidyl aminopeptidase/acylaminoacyl peptidase
MRRTVAALGCCLVLTTWPAGAASAAAVTTPAADSLDLFRLADVFQLEWVSEPQVSPDGRQVVFVRNSYDIMKDRTRTSLWIVNADGSALRALTTGDADYDSPRWSPDGRRLLYVSNAGGSSQIWVRWMDTGQEAELTHLTQSPRGISWSPDGRWIAFVAFVPHADEPMITMPAKPQGADWGPAWRVIDKLHYRQDEVGYLKDGYTHVFIVPAAGGAARQVTDGAFNDGGPEWSPDGKALLFSSNRHDDWQYEPNNSEVYEVGLQDGAVHALTDRKGPDHDPAVSPDGRLIAYLGYDDQYKGYQVTHLYVMNRDGSGKRLVTGGFDRDVESPMWSRDGRTLFIQYDDQGDTKIGLVDLANGAVRKLADHVGGLSIGRPYSGGSYSATPTGTYAFTQSLPDHPADLAVGAVAGGAAARRLTDLNAGLLDHKTLGAVEEFHYKSSFDGRDIQGWIMKPPGFQAGHQYPLLLEIHGGPFANYGDRFAAEDQLYVAAGYVVVYVNPRGSTSYGEQFGNLIDRDYPDHDYDDLMSGVDDVVSRGYIAKDRLFVTGGSGGGVLTAWIVGHTGRFRAAVVQKPVINWYSFVLDADEIPFFYKYWFSGFPWDNLDAYMKRSPISFVGHVTTPTMLISGMEDYRTPGEEAEQFYAGLKLRKIPTMLVRVPDSGHEISLKPSNLVEKVAYVLAWFHRYGGEPGAAEGQ